MRDEPRDLEERRDHPAAMLAVAFLIWLVAVAIIGTALAVKGVW